MDDHIIDHDTGKRYALACPWSPEISASGIPDFLLVENRKPAGEYPPDHIRVNCGPIEPTLDPRLEQSRKLEAAIQVVRAEEKKAKNARGFAKMQAKHPNEKYDRKRKTWVPK